MHRLPSIADREESMNAHRSNVVSRRPWTWVVLAACLPALPLSASAQGNDEQYDVTVKMEIAGMPMAMPPMSQRLCVKKGASDGDYVPRQENCRVSDMARSGSRLTFKIACAGPNPMTGTGDFAFAADGYNGQVRMKGKMEGTDVEMTQAVTGRRSGACTAR
jgi:hypothetical protein